MKNKLLFFYQLGQDLDILLPAMNFALSQGYQVKALLKENLFNSSPRTESLKKLNVEIVELPKEPRLHHFYKSLIGFQTIITATETNVGPHKTAHQLAKLANLMLKKTITFQHGYENIGLTYSDKEYPINKIKFASKKILIWSEELHKNIPKKTKEKCILAGIPKEYEAKVPDEHLKKDDYIAIFENLHWGRFSEYYRKEFLDLLEKISQAYPETPILIKPHHAGKWLTKRYKGTLPDLRNVTILDPDSPEWEPYTAPAVINQARVVISTPSSVCVDAYLQNKPVAVLQFDLELTNYNFAQKCKSKDDVLNFIREPKIESMDHSSILNHDHFLNTFIKVLET